MTEAERAFWSAFLASDAAPADADAGRFESFAIGDGAAADAGAALILAGRKTATSARPDDFAGRPPRPGDLSILCGAGGAPKAVVETLSIRPGTLAGADAALAEAYGEWDRTLEGFRAGMLDHYRGLDPGFDAESPLLFECFRVLWTPTKDPEQA